MATIFRFDLGMQDIQIKNNMHIRSKPKRSTDTNKTAEPDIHT